MPPMAKMGRPPLTPAGPGKRVAFYLSPEAQADLEALAKDGERSALVARLLREERLRVTRSPTSGG
jgi:hypothetical protein